MAENSDDPPKSLRDAFNRECLRRDYPWLQDLSRPEDYPDWLAFSGYEDLLLFERDAGFLSRLIILFVESAGAFAELGAFALDDQLYRKLFVIIPRKHREHPRRQSFLNLGPLKRIERSQGDDEFSNICVIEAEKAHELSEIDMQLVFESLDSWLKQAHSSEQFQKDNPTHRLLLVADLVDLLQVLSEKHAISAAQHFGLSIQKEEMRKLGKLLDLLGLVRLSERGNERYFVSLRAKGSPLIDYDAKSGSRFNRLSFKAKAWEAVNADPRLSPLLSAAR